MNDARRIILRNGGRQPLHKLVHRVELFRLRRLVLFRPAVDLAREVISGLAKIAKADLFVVDRVKIGERIGQRMEKRRARLASDFRQACIPEDAAFDKIHDEERRADDIGVFAECESLWRGEADSVQRRHHLVFALDRMRGGKELSRRLAAQNVFLVRRRNEIGRIRLAALEFLDGDRP